MRVNAYILVGDPAWIEASVLSYYDLVGRIVVSFDAEHRSWTGTALDVGQCLRRLRAIDRDAKLDLRPGRFAREAFFADPQANETHHRQTALDQAGEDADWVVQLDTDEIVCDAARFAECLAKANAAGADGLDYPARWVYRHAGGERYLEQCRRGWRVCAGYPGPVAVRRGVRLRHARQGPERRFRVDFARTTTDPSYPKSTRIDDVISPRQAVAHMSWARTDARMAAKSGMAGHSFDFDWGPLLANWRAAGRRPLWAALRSQAERGNLKRHLRPARIVLPAGVRDRLPAGFDLATGELCARDEPAAAAAPAPGVGLTRPAAIP